MNQNKGDGLSVSALQSGDRSEFAQMVESYSGQIYRLAFKMLGNQLDAEDVLQNTFLKAFQYISGFEGRSSLSTWLYRIAANEALMVIRKQRPTIGLAEESVDESDMQFFPLQLTDWCCLPESELLSGESKIKMDTAIQQLPEKLRIVFILRDIEGLSIEETSQVLSLSQTAVKTRLLRARLKLREHLSSYFRERIIDKEQ